MASFTQPEIVTLTLRFPLRAVVASSSVMRASRSAQQSPASPASAAGVIASVQPINIAAQQSLAFA